MLDINPITNVKDNLEPTPQNPQQEEKKSIGSILGIGKKSDKLSPKDNPLRDTELYMEENPTKLVFYFTLGVSLLVLAFGIYLYFNKSIKNQELITKQKVQQDLNIQLKTPEYARIDALAKRYSLGLDQLSSTLSSQYQYSKLFTHLEQITPNDVVIESFNIDKKNQAKITAVTNNLDESAKFIKSLENSDYFTNVVLSSDQQTTSKDNSKQYNISLTVKINSKMLLNKNLETAEVQQ